MQVPGHSEKQLEGNSMFSSLIEVDSNLLTAETGKPKIWSLFDSELKTVQENDQVPAVSKGQEEIKK